MWQYWRTLYYGMDILYSFFNIFICSTIIICGYISINFLISCTLMPQLYLNCQWNFWLTKKMIWQVINNYVLAIVFTLGGLRMQSLSPSSLPLLVLLSLDVFVVAVKNIQKKIDDWLRCREWTDEQNEWTAEQTNKLSDRRTNRRADTGSKRKTRRTGDHSRREERRS